MTFGASEVDVFGNDPDLDDVDDREEVTLRVRAGQPAVEFIVVRLGSGNCQVELVVVFEISPL